MATADCVACRLSYDDYEESGYENVRPSCDDCFPGVHEYNEAAYTVYNECSDQLIMGLSGIVGLNDLAVNAIMDDYSVHIGEDRLEIRREVKRLSGIILKVRHDKAKATKERK